MTTLFCFGFGYTAEYYVAGHHGRFDRVFGTTRSVQRSAELNASNRPWLTFLTFDGGTPSPRLCAAITEADAILISVPPDAAGDPVLMACSDQLARSSQLRSVVYLSAIGVYGEYNGGWVDEDSECRSRAARSLQRLAAERAWREFGARAGVSVALLRLAGIYGPDRNMLVNLHRGVARRIAKPGHVFNRIHVADIARAIDAAFARQFDGVLNVADDEPASPSEPILFAASLLGIEPPPEISFAEAEGSMTPAALGFYAASKRVSNMRLKALLGVALQFPTYREGLDSLFRDSEY
jgi:nucleoside-diphosphate-sugar epimerase